MILELQAASYLEFVMCDVVQEISQEEKNQSISDICSVELLNSDQLEWLPEIQPPLNGCLFWTFPSAFYFLLSLRSSLPFPSSASLTFFFFSISDQMEVKTG